MSLNNNSHNNSNNKSNNTIDEKTIRKIAHLARIGITDDQVSGFGEDLNKIINTVNTLQEVDTGNTKPMMHPLDITQNLTQKSNQKKLNNKHQASNRQDQVTETKGVHPKTKQNAPSGDADFYFLTPKVLKK